MHHMMIKIVLVLNPVLLQTNSKKKIPTRQKGINFFFFLSWILLGCLQISWNNLPQMKRWTKCKSCGADFAQTLTFVVLFPFIFIANALHSFYLLRKYLRVFYFVFFFFNLNAFYNKIKSINCIIRLISTRGKLFLFSAFSKFYVMLFRHSAHTHSVKLII